MQLIIDEKSSPVITDYYDCKTSETQHTSLYLFINYF